MNMKLLLLVLASFVSLFCWAEKPIVLKPIDPLVFLGECPTFYCTLSSTQYGNSSTLYVKIKRTIMSNDQFEIVDDKTIKFKRCTKDLSQNLMIYCKQDTMTDGIKMSSMDGTEIRIEKALVQIPRDSIKCHLTDWKFLNCTWSLGEKYINENKINVSLKTIQIGSIGECPDLSQTSCQWTNGDLDVTMPFTINLTVFHTSRLDNKLVTVYEVPRSIPVKPSKMKKSLDSTWTNSSCFEIKWKYRYHYKVEFRVILNSTFGENKTFYTRNRHLLVCNLLPSEMYKVGISAIPRYGDGTYSDPLYLDVLTNRTYPSQPPALTKSSFSWTANKSAVYLYWKCLTREQYGAEMVWYLIDIENQRKRAKPGRTLIELPKLKSDKKCWFIQLWAENPFGRSQRSSSITICNNKSVPPATEDVEMLVLNNTHVKVMWSKPSVEKASVSDLQIVIYKNCSVDLQRWDVDANTSSVVLPRGDDGQYSFGVAAENSEGSSGITWASCEYLMTRPLKGIDELLVEQFEDKVQIEWKPYNCKDEQAFIIEYQIKYCKALNNSKCNEKVNSKSVSRSQRKFQISGLPPDDYLFWVEPVTYGDSGPSSVKYMLQVSDTGLGVGVLIVIIIVSVGVFIFIIFGCIYVKTRVSSELEKCDPAVDIPTMPDSSEDYRANRFDKLPHSGDSPTSSAITEMTQLSGSSLCSSSSDESIKLHHYVHLGLDSSGSPASTENNSVNSKKPLQPFTEQNINNNAVTQEVAPGDYVPFNEPNSNSDQSDTSASSGDHLLVFGSSGCGGSLNNVLQQFAGNPVAVGTTTKGSTGDEDMEENTSSEYYHPDYVQNSFVVADQPDFRTERENTSSEYYNPDYVQNSFVIADQPGFCTEREMAENVSSNKHLSGGGSTENLDLTKTMPKQNLLVPGSNKDSPKSQINDSFVSGNCDNSTKVETPSNFSGEKCGNDLMNDVSYVTNDTSYVTNDTSYVTDDTSYVTNDATYVTDDVFQMTGKVFNLNGSCEPKAEVNETGSRNIGDYVSEVPV